MKQRKTQLSKKSFKMKKINLFKDFKILNNFVNNIRKVVIKQRTIFYQILQNTKKNNVN